MDFTNHSKLTKEGIKKYIEKGGKMGRPKRKLPIKDIKKLLKKGLTIEEVSRKLDIPSNTLRSRRSDFE
jgi:DNA invertase Pin-like site-specific DNA recombinase